MSQRSDIDRVLEVWMADGPTAIPDRVVDVVAARIGVQRQRRAWPFPWRTTVTTQVKLVAALAAVIVVAVAGFSILGRPSGSNVGGNPSSAPSPSQGTGSPTPSVSAAPSASAASAVYPAWYTGERAGAGILSAGNQSTRNFTPGFTFTVPEGWVNLADALNAYDLIPDTPANAAEHAASSGLAQEIGVFRHETPYWRCDTWEDHRGATAAEIVASLVATDAISTSKPVDVTIGGLKGKQVDIRVDPAWTETCPGDPPTLDLGDMRTRVILLDTPTLGVMFINIGSLHSADQAAFLAEAMPIVESFEFDLAQ